MTRIRCVVERITPGHELTTREQEYVVNVVMEWIGRQYKKGV